MLRRAAIGVIGILCCGLASSQDISIPLKDTDTGSGLKIVGPAEIEPRYGEDYGVQGLATENLGRAKIVVFPEEGVRVKTGRPWGDGDPYLTVRVRLGAAEQERLIRLWVVVDHVPRVVKGVGLGVADTWEHVPDEWAHIDILVKRPGPPPPPVDPPDLTLGDVADKETSASVEVPVKLSKPAPADVLFDYRTKDGTATAGQDYKQTGGRGTITQGSSSFVVAVPLIDDDDAEGAETFTVELSNVTNANALQTVATVTIEDDDKPAVTELAGVIILDPQAEQNQGAAYAITLYGDPINDLLGAEKWQPISTQIDTTHEWLDELIAKVTGESLPEPHLFLMDWETKEVVWSGRLPEDVDEAIELVKRFMP